MSSHLRPPLRRAIVAFVVCGATSFGQGEDCLTAAPVGEGVFSGSNATSTDDCFLGCCPTADQWFLYTPSTSGNAAFVLCGTSFDGVVALFDAAGGCASPTLLGCAIDGCVGGATLVHPVTAGGSYFAVLGAAGFGAGSWTLSISCAPTPSNDACAAATSIGDGLFAGTTAGASFDGINPDYAYPDAADVWFSYLPTCTGYASFSTCPTLGGSSSVPTAVRAWQAGPCPPSSPVAMVDQPCGGPGVGAWIVTTQVTAGTPVMIQVVSPLDQRGAFVLAATCAAPPFNDSCATAVPVLTGTNGPYSNVFGGWGGSSVASCSYSAEANVWFSWTAPAQGSVAVQACPYGHVAVYVSCGGGEAACEAAACGVWGGPAIFGIAQAGATYYFKVTGPFDVVISFTLDVWYPYQMTAAPVGPAAYEIGQRFGPPNLLFFTAATLNEGNFPFGAFYGVDISAAEIAAEVFWPGGLPFLGFLDSTGAATNLTLPNAPLLGLHVYMVSTAYDPATGFAFVAATPPFEILL
jgi:hypothetical protein